MSNEKLTAVDWLTKKLWDEFGMAFSNNILEQAKAIEKQQIVEAYQDGRSDQHSKEPKFYNRNSEYYYSQTYSNHE